MSSPSSSDKAPHSAPASTQRAGALPPLEAAVASPRRDPGSGPALSDFGLAVLKELTHYLSEPNAKALLMASASATGVNVSKLAPAHLPQVVAQVAKTFDVFGLGSAAKQACLGRLRSLPGTAGPLREDVIPIVQESDIVTARDTGREICIELGFTEVAWVKVATVISELARNIVKYAGKGAVTLRALRGHRPGIEVVAADQGPGIPDTEAVMSPRFRSKTGMGVGLRGSRRVMDEFEIKSQVGRGTTVTTRKYLG